MRKNGGMEDSDESDVEEDMDFENPQASSSSLLDSPSTDSDEGGCGGRATLTSKGSLNNEDASSSLKINPNPSFAASSMLFRNNPMLTANLAACAAASLAAANRNGNFFPNPLAAAAMVAAQATRNNSNSDATQMPSFSNIFQHLINQQQAIFHHQQQQHFIRQQQLFEYAQKQQQDTTTIVDKPLKTPIKKNKLLIDNILNLKTAAKANRTASFSMSNLITTTLNEEDQQHNNEEDEEEPTDTSNNSSDETTILNQQHEIQQNKECIVETK